MMQNSTKIPVLIVDDNYDRRQWACRSLLQIATDSELALKRKDSELALKTKDSELLALIRDCYEIAECDRVDLAIAKLQQGFTPLLGPYDVDFQDIDTTDIDEDTIRRESKPDRGFDLLEPTRLYAPDCTIVFFTAQPVDCDVLKKAEGLGLVQGKNFIYENANVDPRVLRGRMLGLLKNIAQRLIWKLIPDDKKHLADLIKRNTSEAHLLDTKVTINSQQMYIKHLLMCCAEVYYDTTIEKTTIRYNGVKAMLTELLATKDHSAGYEFIGLGNWAKDYMKQALIDLETCQQHEVWKKDITDRALSIITALQQQLDHIVANGNNYDQLRLDDMAFTGRNSFNCQERTYGNANVLYHVAFQRNFKNAQIARLVILTLCRLYCQSNVDSLLERILAALTGRENFDDLSKETITAYTTTKLGLSIIANQSVVQTIPPYIYPFERDWVDNVINEIA